ncbi:hypothetical protein ABIA35_004157 [Catenulispora sp. MAP12-49]
MDHAWRVTGADETAVSESSGIAVTTKRPMRLLAGGSAALVLGFSSVLLWLSGSVHARVTSPQPGDGGDTWRQDRKEFTTGVLIKNDGWSALRIVGVGRDEPGLRLLASDDSGITHPFSKPSASVPFTLQPGETVAVTIAYQVTDCAAVGVGKLPIPIRIERTWGTETASVTHSMYQEGNDILILDYRGADAVEWQRALADKVCGADRFSDAPGDVRPGDGGA